MNTAADLSSLTQKARSLGHAGIHYRPGEAQQAVRLFELLGCRIKSFGPFPNGDFFYIIALNAVEPDAPDNIIFLSSMSAQQAALEEELSKHLGAGTNEVHPALTAFLNEKIREPEFFLHLGIHYASLADLEETIMRLQEAKTNEPQFGGRVQGFQVLRARSGRDADIDARMASSSVFSEVEQEAYGQNIVQVHIRTDLFAVGLGFLGAVIELDYAFTGPGRERNTFNDLIMD